MQNRNGACSDYFSKVRWGAATAPISGPRRVSPNSSPRSSACTTTPIPLDALSDISGVSGQAIIRAVLKGERDAKLLAKLRDPRCQASEEEIVQSLQGNWKEDVLFELQQAVDAYDFYQQQMKKCDQQLRRYMAALPPGRARKSRRQGNQPA